MHPPVISFVETRPQGASSSARADVAMFVGRVGRRPGALPATLRERLTSAGWTAGGIFAVTHARLEALLDVPAPVESWSEFDALYDWRSQPELPGDAAERLPCPLGLAVRQFFEQGGAKAHIVRTGDPLPLAEPGLGEADFIASRQALLSRPASADDDQSAPMLPGWRGRGREADPLDPATWRGAALVYAVEEAALLVLPDLAHLCAGPPETPTPVPEPPGPPETFKPCAPAAPAYKVEERVARPRYRAPRLDRTGFRRWSSATRFVLDLLGRPRGPAHRRDVTLIASLPLPRAAPEFGSEAATWPLDLLALPGMADGGQPLFAGGALGNARLQLAYPWLATPAAQSCPEGLQGGEGALAGIIARSTLAQGAFRTAAGAPLRGPARLYPEIAGSDISRGRPGDAEWLGERLSLFGVRRGQVELISDATMADSRAWRDGGVSRLMGLILRAARAIGEDLVFEPQGPAVWNRLRDRVDQTMSELYRVGAFDGQTAAEAYQVACDRTTMTQADIDAGRVLCTIAFQPARPVERIVVTLALLDATRFEEAA